MKNIIKILIIAFTLVASNTNAQTVSGRIDDGEQTVGLATGIDYSILPIVMSYNRGINIGEYKHTFQTGIEATIPVFLFDLNDHRIKLKFQNTVYRNNKFDVSAGINPVFIHSKLRTQVMSSIGADFLVRAGYVNEKWNIAGEFTYNKIVSSYIKHTDIYKDNVFADVQDGWYKNTASNLRIGASVNRRINKVDLYLKAGISNTGKNNAYLFVPSLYALIGANYKF